MSRNLQNSQIFVVVSNVSDKLPRQYFDYSSDTNLTVRTSRKCTRLNVSIRHCYTLSDYHTDTPGYSCRIKCQTYTVSCTV